MARRYPIWVLAGMALILLFASFLYLRDINGLSLWEDESWMAIAIRGDLPGVWTFATEKGLHPPLYFYLAWFFSRAAGESEVALRWLGGLCALVGIALTCRLGTDLFDRRTGVFAALIAAGSLFLMYFARTARHYTLFFTLAVALVWAYERWRRNPSSRRGLIAIILLQAALLYTHYFGVWMALAIGLHGLLTLAWRDRLRLIGGLAVSGVLFLPWIPSILSQYSSSTTGLGYAVFDSGAALSSYLDAAFNTLFSADYGRVGLVLLALGIVAIWRQRKFSAGLLLALWLVLPVVLTLALNDRFHIFVQRNMLFTLGAAVILFGAGLGWIANYRYGRIPAAAFALLFALIAPLHYWDFWSYVTPDWRETARQIAVDAHPDDLFVIRAEPYSMDYYLRRFLAAPVSLVQLDDWMQDPVTPDRIWLIDSSMAVRFEAIDALAPDVILTHRPVVLPVVAELYQRPPQTTLTVFDERFALAANLDEPLTAAPGRNFTIQLWWRRQGQVDVDYSVGVYLVSPAGVTVAQHDGAFDRGRIVATTLPEDTWTPDERTLTLPDDVESGEYTLLVSVYDWRDETRLPPTGGRDDNLYVLGAVQIR